MRDISGYITEDNKASYKGKTVYELYSIFIYIGKSNLLLFSADGKQRAKYSILNISKLGRAMISFLNAPSIHPYSAITRFEARLTAPILFKQPFHFVHNLHSVALTV